MLAGISILTLAFLFTIVNRLYSKKALNSLDSYATTVLSNGVSAIVALPFFFMYARPLQDFTQKEVIIIVLLGALWSIASWAINESIALNDFSFKEIIRQTRVLWVVLGGVFILGERLSMFDVVGILILVAAVFLISYKKVTLRQHLTSKPILLAWFSSLLIAGITLLEKYLLGSVEVVEYVPLNYLFTTLFLLIWINTRRIQNIKTTLHTYPKEITIFSLLMMTTYSLGVASYAYFPISIAYPIIQSASVFAVLIGTRIFEDNLHLMRKGVAAALSIVGIIFIQLF